MEIADLATFDANSLFEADVAIVGGGPAGLTIAREFFGDSARVILLESGLLQESRTHDALSQLESVGQPSTEVQRQKRIDFHGASSRIWSHDTQPYGVRSRLLGGSTNVWAGKSAAFDFIDFAERPWVPHSGWPLARELLDPHLDRAAKILNLGPNSYDEALWKLIGIAPPQPQLDRETLRSFFWQFSRSRLDRLDIMRFGAEFVTFQADNVRVLLNATVTQIELDQGGRKFQGLEISTIDGVQSRVKAKVAVIAASAIENARLLLTSRAIHACGIGNANDVVGRFLMDHAGARIGRFDTDSIQAVERRFGFYGLRDGGRTHMYMHGLALTPFVQERDELLNAAVYFMPERSSDDPWDALKRLLQRNSSKPALDVMSVLRGTKFLARGIGMKMLSSGAMPNPIKDLIVNTAIRLSPNLVAEEFQSRGLPHKINGISIDAISEQKPDPESRITLSQRTDRLGIPMAKVNWRINDHERRTIAKIAELTKDAFSQAALPVPIIEPWIVENRLHDGIIIDMAHTIGTTRMSSDPKRGVVDEHCQVHGVAGLYIAGASTFPTSGHANPTLMIVALAVRLADTIKLRLPQL